MSLQQRRLEAEAQASTISNLRGGVEAKAAEIARLEGLVRTLQQSKEEADRYSPSTFNPHLHSSSPHAPSAFILCPCLNQHASNFSDRRGMQRKSWQTVVCAR